MPIRFLDHLAITVEDVERTIDFYQRVAGATICYEDAWRAGKMPVAILQLGDSRLSVHPAAAPAEPHARTPAPGSADFCFRWEGSLADAARHLERQGVEVVEGPVQRPASDGSLGNSIYFRDPDGNLVEFLSTDSAEGAE